MILKNQKGSVLVEFAIVLPILIVLIYAVQDLATYVSYSKEIEKITKNTVNLPTKLKQIYDAENPTNLSNYDHIDAKNMLLAIINASKLIFYTYSNDITKNNFPGTVRVAVPFLILFSSTPPAAGSPGYHGYILFSRRIFVF